MQALIHFSKQFGVAFEQLTYTTSIFHRKRLSIMCILIEALSAVQFLGGGSNFEHEIVQDIAFELLSCVGCPLLYLVSFMLMDLCTIFHFLSMIKF